MPIENIMFALIIVFLVMLSLSVIFENRSKACPPMITPYKEDLPRTHYEHGERAARRKRRRVKA